MGNLTEFDITEFVITGVYCIRIINIEMRNSKSAYLFTYNNIWKLASISYIYAVSISPSI